MIPILISCFNLTNVLSGLIVSVVVFYLLPYVWSRARIFYYASKIKGPLALPLIGSSYLFLGGTEVILERLELLMVKYKSLFKIWLGSKMVVFPTLPDDIKTILNNSLEKGPLYKFILPTFGNGLFVNPEVSEWKKHRKTIQLMFSQKILNDYVGIFVKYSNILTQKLEVNLNKDCVDMFPILSECTLDIICGTTMGIEANALKTESPLLVWMARVSEMACLRMVRPYLHWDVFWNLSPFSKETNSISTKFDKYIEKIIEEKRNGTSGQIKCAEKHCLLDNLIKLTDEEGKWTIQELVAEIRTLIVAGGDAPAVSVCHVLIALGLHPEIQDRVYEELCDVIVATETVQKEDLSKLTYLEQVIKETWRILPVATLLARHLTEDVILDSNIVPKGSSVVVNIFHLHRNPEFWSDPLKFDPNRFLPEEATKRHPYCYIPFSGGPRSCIGYRFAMMVVKTMVVTILRKYKIVDTGYRSIEDIKLKFDIASKCVGGYQIKLALR